MMEKTELERFVEEPEPESFELITISGTMPDIVNLWHHTTTGTPPNNILMGAVEGYGIFDGSRQ